MDKVNLAEKLALIHEHWRPSCRRAHLQKDASARRTRRLFANCASLAIQHRVQLTLARLSFDTGIP